MFKIVRIPKALESFFRSLTGCFHWGHYSIFCLLVLSMATGFGRRNTSNLHRQIFTQLPRPRFNEFLTKKYFNIEAMLADKAVEIMKACLTSADKTIYLILDDTKKRKRGKHMDGVSKVYCSDTNSFMLGHQYVMAVIRIGQTTIPFAVSLYVKPEFCQKHGLTFRKTTELAAEIIRRFHAPAGSQVVVLFDSYYLCPPVVRVCEEKGFSYISTLKDNRNFTKHGRVLNVGQSKLSHMRYGRLQTVALKKRGGREATFRYCDLGEVGVSKLGSVHVVFSRRVREKRILALVTNDLLFSADEIIRQYAERWFIEVFFKDCKQLLGLGQYQNRSYRAAVIHLHLVCFAYALLTHWRLTLSEKGKKKKKNAVALSSAEVQDDLRRLSWESLVAKLEKQSDGKSFVKELKKLLVA